MEYMKVYDFDLSYHSGKTSMVVNTLSKKSYLTSMIKVRE